MPPADDDIAKPLSMYLAAFAVMLLLAASWFYLPAGSKEEHAARVLAKTGPRGAGAYQAATADGTITNRDMQKIRDGAGEDIDSWDLAGSNSIATEER